MAKIMKSTAIFEKLKMVVIFRADLEYTIINSMYKITVKLQRLSHSPHSISVDSVQLMSISRSGTQNLKLCSIISKHI